MAGRRKDLQTAKMSVCSRHNLPYTSSSPRWRIPPCGDEGKPPSAFVWLPINPFDRIVGALAASASSCGACGSIVGSFAAPARLHFFGGAVARATKSQAKKVRFVLGNRLAYYEIIHDRVLGCNACNRKLWEVIRSNQFRRPRVNSAIDFALRLNVVQKSSRPQSIAERCIATK